MEYSLSHKLRNEKILLEILQNRFPKFDDSVVKWTFKENKIDTKTLENKILNNYNNKIGNASNSNQITYLDWIELFDSGLNNLKKYNKQPILFFSGGKDSTFIASRLIQNKIDALYYSFVKNENEKKILDEFCSIYFS